jgi:hydroxymethylpyrimidine/phosphomethylpyrimidine kinase
VSNTNPTVVLVVGPFDPSGSGNLPADAVTCAGLGAHALSTITAVHVQDTISTEDIQLMPAELIDDQARCLLEDMNIQAIKVSGLYSIESVQVLAQIAADYAHVPLVLHLGALPDTTILEDEDPDDIMAALFELLLPQTDLVLAEHSLIAHWKTDGPLQRTSADSPAQALLEHGAQWVLSTSFPIRPGQSAYLLHGPEQATFNWKRPAPPPTHSSNANGPLSCALTIELGKGVAMPKAVENALALAGPLAANTFQPGMGSRLINRSTT